MKSTRCEERRSINGRFHSLSRGVYCQEEHWVEIAVWGTKWTQDAKAYLGVRHCTLPFTKKAVCVRPFTCLVSDRTTFRIKLRSVLCNLELQDFVLVCSSITDTGWDSRKPLRVFIRIAVGRLHLQRNHSDKFSREHCIFSDQRNNTQSTRTRNLSLFFSL